MSDFQYANEPIRFGEYLTEGQVNKLLSKAVPPSCCHCCFWEEHEGAIWDSNSVGWSEVCENDPSLIALAATWDGTCMRNPPTIVPEIAEEDGCPNDWGFWPTTRYTHWCGEYQQSVRHTEVPEDQRIKKDEKVDG